MALVATVLGKSERLSPSYKLVTGTLALDNPYGVGGYLPTATQFGGKEVVYISAVAETYYGEWVPSTGRLKIIVGATGVEAGAIDLSGVTAMPFLAIVKSTW